MASLFGDLSPKFQSSSGTCELFFSQFHFNGPTYRMQRQKSDLDGTVEHHFDTTGYELMISEFLYKYADPAAKLTQILSFIDSEVILWPHKDGEKVRVMQCELKAGESRDPIHFLIETESGRSELTVVDYIPEKNGRTRVDELVSQARGMS